MTDPERSRQTILNAIAQCPDPELRGRADQELTALLAELSLAQGREIMLAHIIQQAQAALWLPPRRSV